MMNWRELLDQAKQEPDPTRRRDLCPRARRLIQDRQLDLVHLPGDHRQEEEALQAVLRELWVIENARDTIQS